MSTDPAVMAAAEALRDRSVPFGECLIFTGTPSHAYGQIRVNGRMMRAHRVAWMAAHGSIPEGYEIDHLCFTPRCVAVEHLEAVTPEINRDRIRFHPETRVTHCPKGHEHTGERNNRGGRICRECSRAQSRAWWRANRGVSA